MTFMTLNSEIGVIDNIYTMVLCLYYLSHVMDWINRGRRSVISVEASSSYGSGRY